MPFSKVIARAGKWNGVDVSESLLASLADRYDGADESKRAPAVIGHPTDNAPAYGWVDSLHYNDADKTLTASICETVPAFVDAVKNKIFPKVSMSYYLPNATSNPNPNGVTLRHVGFLGGHAPAIPNLPLANFVGDGDDYNEFTTVTDDDATYQQPTKEVSTMADTPTTTTPQTQVATTPTDTAVADFAEREALLAKREAEMQEREQAVTLVEQKVREDSIKATVAEWTREGKLPPAFAERAEVILRGIESPADFADADGKTLSQRFVELMSDLPKHAVFSKVEVSDAPAPMSAVARGKAIAAHMQANPQFSALDAEADLISNGKLDAIESSDDK